MQQIQTASWTETRTRWETFDNERTYSAQEWLRTTPPAEASCTDYGHSCSHQVTDERGRLTTFSRSKICNLYPHIEPYDGPSLSRRVLFMPPEQDASSRCPDRIWRHEVVEHESRPVNHWFREYVQDNFRVAEAVWSELLTHRILRKECLQTDPRAVPTFICGAKGPVIESSIGNARGRRSATHLR